MTDVLVVGGDVVQTELIKAALEASDLVVEKREDGNQAMSVLRASNPGVVVLDINLSKPNAVELLRRIRLRGAADRPRILGVIMPGEAELEERCNSLGVDLFIQEPFSPERLVEGVRRLLKMAT